MRKGLLRLVLCLLTAAFIVQGFAGTIKGKIVDESGLVLPGANIFISELELGAASDQNGDYWISGVSAGTYDLTVSYIGYQEKVVEVTVEEVGSAVMNVELESGVVYGSEVIVLGDRLKGQAKAIQQQKSNDNITNVVSSDQIGRFPDASVGDAVKRIPGIHVNYDQGEARFVNIRGTEPRFNSVMINGDRMPSAEGEIRAAQVDLIPSDMIQTIEVSKAIKADMDADAIGGVINLVTRQAPSGLRISATMGSGMNMLREEPILLGSGVIANRFLNDKLGVVVSGSYYDHKLGSDNSEGEWNDYDNGYYPEEWDVRTYELRRLRKSAAIGLDYELSADHKILFNAMYNHRNDWENRFRLRYIIENEPGTGGVSPGVVIEDEGTEDEEEVENEVRRQTKAGGPDQDYKRLEDQRVQSFSLRGDHLFGGKIKVDWSAGTAKASEERPNERYISYLSKGEDVAINKSDERNPYFTLIDNWNDFELKEITEEHQYTDEIDTKAKLDISMPLIEDGKYANKIKLGVKYKKKEKERDNNFYEYEPLDEEAFTAQVVNNLIDKSKDDFLAGDYKAGRFVDPKFLGDLNLKDASLFEESDLPEEYAADNYVAEEVITAGYLMLDQNIGDQWKVNVGLRMEQTNVDYTGNEWDENTEQASPTSGSDDYMNILPSLHARYDLDENTVFRAAWTNTIARPNYYDLVPFRNVSEDFEELEVGNPALEPTTSMNLDLMAERYFKSVGLVSAGIFYKSINDFIYIQQIDEYADPVSGNTFEEFYQPRNGAEATLIGFEFAVQRQLNFLPGILKNLGAYVNLTYTTSEADNPNLSEQVDGDEKIELPGTAPITLNAALSYQTSKAYVGLQFNYTDAYVDPDEMDLTPGLERYYDVVTYLDLNASYVITPQIRVFAEANNLLNQPLRYYAGDPDRTYQAEYYDRRFTAGLKFDL